MDIEDIKRAITELRLTKYFMNRCKMHTDGSWNAVPAEKMTIRRKHKRCCKKAGRDTCAFCFEPALFPSTCGTRVLRSKNGKVNIYIDCWTHETPNTVHFGVPYCGNCFTSQEFWQVLNAPLPYQPNRVWQIILPYMLPLLRDIINLICDYDGFDPAAPIKRCTVCNVEEY